MAAKNWREEVGDMPELRSQIKELLENIAEGFDETGGTFDENFRNEFFHVTNSLYD